MEHPSVRPSASAGSELKALRVTVGEDGSIYERTYPQDPDAGLSQEEKDEIVRRSKNLRPRGNRLVGSC